jgi:hypothetical protein
MVDQILLPGLVRDIENFYGPAYVDRGPRLCPTRFQDVELFYAHYIEWTQPVRPQCFKDAEVIWAPVVAHDSLRPGLVVSADVIWTPTVIGGY